MSMIFAKSFSLLAPNALLWHPAAPAGAFLEPERDHDDPDRFPPVPLSGLQSLLLAEVLPHSRAEFPGLVSYNRFVEFIPSVLVPLCTYFQQRCLGDCSGVSFINSTSLEVCLNQRIGSHKVFAGLAERGKTSTGWFFGFKLHLVINDRGELLSVLLTPGNVDDRKPVPKLVRKLFGKVFGDKGYISKPLYELLRQTFGVPGDEVKVEYQEPTTHDLG